MKKKGSLIWITGLSGSGKSQVAKKLKQKLKQEKMDYLLFNGDDLRKIFKLNKYDATSRKRYAASYSKFCKKITDQGVNLMFAAVAMIDQTRKWNKKNIPNYCEIYIKVPIKIIRNRNKKNLYRSQKKNVVGKDIKFPEPFKSDLIIENNYDKSYKKELTKIIKKINGKI